MQQIVCITINFYIHIQVISFLKSPCMSYRLFKFHGETRYEFLCSVCNKAFLSFTKTLQCCVLSETC